MPLLCVPMLCLPGIMIALYRRNPQRFLDGPTEDAPLRLLRWAVGLLSPQQIHPADPIAALAAGASRVRVW